jgi:hypothetical protein
VQYFERDTFMFKFDLKSGYFHLDICPQQHAYLGFMWKRKFYCFTVLVFGISMGKTKLLAPIFSQNFIFWANLPLAAWQDATSEIFMSK